MYTEKILKNIENSNIVETAEEARELYVLHRADNSNPAVYVGTYYKYNCGSLCGMWVDLTTFDDYEEFITFCKAIHADEPDPEFMCQDYQNFCYDLYSECLSENDFNRIMQYIELNEEYNEEAVDAFVDCFGIDYLDNFEECYVGKYDSEEDFAEEIVNDCYNIGKAMGSLARYFDYKAFARELFMCDYNYSEGYVFRNC